MVSSEGELCRQQAVGGWHSRTLRFLQVNLQIFEFDIVK